jgi:hypothetical protein
MMDDRVLIFIVMLLLTYVFDHKILPQLGVIALAIIEIYMNITEVGVTSSTSMYFMLFIINIIYCAFMIVVAPSENNINEYL